MAIRGLWHILTSIGSRGPRYAWNSALQRANERYYERRLGIESGTMVNTDALGFDNADNHYYSATPYRIFRRLLKEAPPSTATASRPYVCCTR